jgi:NAD(P)-dependent dehydrogenase (short-subunit alcohol dehydrogenase family)
MDLKRTRALVTGGASGIGFAIAKRLIDGGARVLVADIDETSAKDAAKRLGPAAIGVGCNVGDHAAVEALGRHAESLFGGIDLAFANAGVMAIGPAIEATPEQFDWLMGINVRGAWSTASVFALQMKRLGINGRICITGSENSLGLQHVDAAFYTASKHAVLGLADVLRAELEPDISVSLLCPGLVSTRIHAAGENTPGYLPDADARAFAAALVAEGKDPAIVAEAAVEGTMAGEFLIVTHGASRAAALRRAAEVEAAFERGGPWGEEEDSYNVNNVTARVLAAGKFGKS